MSEKELDEILNEIKMNSRAKNSDSFAHPETENGAVNTNKEKIGNLFSDEKEDEGENTASPAQQETNPFEAANKDEAGSDEEPKNETTDDNFADSNIPQDDSAEESEAFNLSEIASAPTQETQPAPTDKLEKKNKETKKIVIAIVAAVLIAAIAVGVYFAFFNNEKSTPSTTSAKTTSAQVADTTDDSSDSAKNPLTGESGYSTSALNQRPVAVVVENEYSTESVRPQWGLSDADIVLEGESEFSTRMLLFWANYNKMPSQIGPTRSARPPFIRFSQLFDSIFIHAGLSRSKGNYTGADTVFESENIDHINLLSLSGDGTYFGRDKTKTSTIEHTGYLNGTNTAKLIEEKNIDTKLDESKFSVLKFNDKAADISSNTADSVVFKWSSKCPKKGTYTYDKTTGKYTTTDFDSAYGKSNVAWENIILLLDETTYIVKDNYKGSGKGETYCDYSLSGGSGMVLSNGTYVNIKWGVSNGKLWLKNAETNEEITLNPGKSYIGYGSSNNGGSITLGSDAQ